MCVCVKIFYCNPSWLDILPPLFQGRKKGFLFWGWKNFQRKERKLYFSFAFNSISFERKGMENIYLLFYYGVTIVRECWRGTERNVIVLTAKTKQKTWYSEFVFVDEKFGLMFLIPLPNPSSQKLNLLSNKKPKRRECLKVKNITRTSLERLLKKVSVLESTDSLYIEKKPKRAKKYSCFWQIF